MLPTPELEIAKNLPAGNCTVAEAERYTRWLATHHYENFSVASWLLPRGLHQHFYNVYSYCRWSDDLGDEIGDRARSLTLLDDWENALHRIYSGESGPSHPVLIALAGTIRAKDIPEKPFTDLLRAFRQDQTTLRYQTWEGLLDYCVYSANPVGRLVLYLCGYRDEPRQLLSDHTCTALQLANFWQDVSRDMEKGRIYIPLDIAAQHGVSEEDILQRCFDARYLALMKSLIARTRDFFDAGWPLTQQVDRVLQIDLELFSKGGMAILDAIESEGYNTLRHRPSLSKVGKLRLLAGALGAKLLPGAPPKGERRAKAPGMSKETLPAALRPNTATPVSVAASYAECARIARASRSSFYLAFFGLPKDKRNALCALYAFMRLVDDVSDDPGDIDSKRRGIARWRGMLDQAVGGDTSAHPVLPALTDTISRFDIPARYFHDLILGAEMDLTVATYTTFDRLSEYCYRVAGTVGLTCLHVFGFRDPHSPDLAERLGLAFQLTNIIRDVRADYEMGRVYLPLDELQRFGVREPQLAGPLTPQLRALLEYQAERAWRLYEEGVPLVANVDADSRATLWALIRTYSTLLARIEERDFEVFASRVSLSGAEKIQYLLTAGVTSSWWKKDALAKRSGDRRRTGGNVLRRRAG